MPRRPRGVAGSGCLAACLACGAAGCRGGSAQAPFATTNPDASAKVTYAVSGPLATERCVVVPGSTACTLTPSSDASAAGAVGALYEIFYPAAMSSMPGRAPILTWGNGTDAVPDQYSVLLTHLASWGFVVVASTSQNTGTGLEMLAGEDFLVAANADPASPFYDALDLANVGALGHSQGADGAALAMLGADAPGSKHAFIKTLVPIEMPGQQWTCFGNTDPSCLAAESFDASSLRYGSVFFVDGSKDLFFSPPTQTPTTTGEQSVAAYYAATPAPTPHAKATLLGADHSDIQDHCTVGLGCAGVGPTGYLGYITAWLRYELADDAAAGLAFRGPEPEIDADPAWEDQAQAALP